MWAFTPAEFLGHLKSRVGPGNIYTIVEPLKGWVRKEHIPALMALLDSEEPCTAVVDAHSSFWPGSSTVGREAAMMITGYLAGLYPPALHSQHGNVKSKEELRAWWEREMGTLPIS